MSPWVAVSDEHPRHPYAHDAGMPRLFTSAYSDVCGYSTEKGLPPQDVCCPSEPALGVKDPRRKVAEAWHDRTR